MTALWSCGGSTTTENALASVPVSLAAPSHLILEQNERFHFISDPEFFKEKDKQLGGLIDWDPKNNQQSIHCHTYSANYPTSLSHFRLQSENEDKNNTAEISKRPDKAGHETLIWFETTSQYHPKSNT